MQTNYLSLLMNAHRRISIPANWKAVQKSGKNYIYRCPVMSNDKTQQCIFTGRPEQIRKHIDENNHVFSITSTTIYKEEENVKKKIEKLVIQVGGELQLSLTQLSSSSFKTFIQGIISLTGNYVLKHERERFIPETFFEGFARNTVKQKILEQSKEKSQTRRLEMRKFSKYVSISCDAGTVEKHSLLEFLLCNPSSGLKPVLIYSTNFEDHSSANFFNEVSNAIQKAKEEDFFVTAIVADNVSYQKSILAHWNPNSKINSSNDEMIRSLLYITCNCHNLDLVVTQMTNTNELFSNVTYCATLLADLSRKKEYFIYLKTMAPKIPATRWLYLYEFTNWILENETSIQEFLSNAPTVIQDFQKKKEKYEKLLKISLTDFKKVNSLLKPLRKLNDQLESDSCTLYYVVPLVELCGQRLRKIIQTEQFADDTTGKELLRIFTARFRKTAVEDVLCLAYSLTAEGRFYMGLSPTASQEEKEKEEKAYFKLTKAPQLLRVQAQNERILSSDKIKYRKCFNDYIEKVVETMKVNAFKKFDDELERLRGNEEQILEIFPDKFVKSQAALTFHLNRLGYPLTKIEEIKQQYNLFIHIRHNEESERLSLYMNSEPHLMWKNLHNANLFKALSEYALIFCSIPASEASVERLFSSMKKYLSSRQRSSNELIDCYLQLLPQNYSIDMLSFDFDESSDENTSTNPNENENQSEESDETHQQVGEKALKSKDHQKKTQQLAITNFIPTSKE